MTKCQSFGGGGRTASAREVVQVAPHGSPSPDAIKVLTIYQPYLAGVLHGDGWCTPRSFGLRCKDRDFAELFAVAANEVCGTKLSVRVDERGYCLVRAGNRTGRFDALRSYDPRDNDELASWLRGLFDSEGNVQLLHLPKSGPNSYQRRIAMYSTRLRTLARAAMFLDWLEIPHKIYRTKNSASHKGSKTVYALNAVRRDGLVRFAEIVGSSIQRKQVIMQAMAGSFQPPGWQARNWQKAVAARWGAA